MGGTAEAAELSYLHENGDVVQINHVPMAAIAKLGVYIATEGDFRDHPEVADGGSEMLVKVFGVEKLSGRVVLGVASLPLGLPVELELVLQVET